MDHRVLPVDFRLVLVDLHRAIHIGLVIIIIIVIIIISRYDVS